MVADWCEQHAGTADVRKLWLFDNRLGDEGAAAVARILRHHPAMMEVKGRGRLRLGVASPMCWCLHATSIFFCCRSTSATTC